MKKTKFIAEGFDLKSLLKRFYILNNQNQKKNEASKLSLKIPQFIKWVARTKMCICFQIRGQKKAWRKIQENKEGKASKPKLTLMERQLQYIQQ